MRFLLALIAPPFALLVCGKPVQFALNLVFWLISIPLLFFFIGFILWAVCTAHALTVCFATRADRNVQKIVQAIEQRNQMGMYR